MATAKIFKTASTSAKSKNDVIMANGDMINVVDSYKKLNDEIKHLEGEATIFKNEFKAYAHNLFSERVITGKTNNFKVEGKTGSVSYIVQDASSGITDEDYAAFTEKWGKKAAKELIMDDLGSIKFDADVLTANYDAVVTALQNALPAEVLESLFKPMLMKAAKGAVDKAAKIAKDPEKLAEMLTDLKVKTQVRA